MKRSLFALALIAFLTPYARAEELVYHDIKTDANGRIVPWYSPDPAASYDHVIQLVMNFWYAMKPCPNGVPYYLQHQVWKPEHDPRGLGGDQIPMALSSWNLFFGYSGNPGIRQNMRTMADYWIDHGFSSATCKWANLPFPYNLDVHSGIHDGDMRAGKGYLQPDKAASFGAELVVLHKMTGEKRYLEKVIGIADTLARNIAPGDAEHSPWPYRVHAVTGEQPKKASPLTPRTTPALFACSAI